MHLQFRADDDYRAGRIVDTLTEQILAETSLLTLQAVGQRLERSVRLGFDGIALARVVEQRVDGLLQHTLLVAQDHLRRLDFDQALQTVVADNHASIQVVQVRSGETTAVQRHERTQLGGDNRNHFQNHPLGLVDLARLAERLDNMQPLQRLGLTLLGSLRSGLVAERIGQLVQIHALQQRIDRLGAHLRDELVRIAVVELLIAFRKRVQDVEILLLGQQVQIVDAVGCSRSGLNHHVALVIDDRLQLFGRNAEQIADFRGQRTEIPDMSYRNDQRDMSHPLAAHFLFGHLDAATVADDALVTDPFVFAAMALVVFDRTENPLAEKTVALGLTIVYCLGLQHFSARVFQNLLGRGQTDRNLGEAALCLVVFLE